MSNLIEQTGLTKLIYSGVLPELFDTQIRLIEDPARFVKAAADSGGTFDYEKLAPDKDHVGIHLIALGDVERYGFNRNGDGFPKTACAEYHNTFVDNGTLFRHHQNKDRKKGLGKVAASMYSDPMGRIELFVHAHKEKAQPELEKLEKTGEVPFSMACRVKFDRCSMCNNIRKSSRDPEQCDHVKYDLGKVAEDGRITGTYNDEPNFFDISFVWRPADRIAWSLKTASDGTLDSVKLAYDAGLYVPERILLDSGPSQEKHALARKLADAERRYFGIDEKGPVNGMDSVVWELRKAASTRTFSDETLDQLRAYEPGDTFYVLAENQIVMDPTSFFKYATGSQYSELAPYMEKVEQAICGIYDHFDKSGELAALCGDGTYDATFPDRFSLYEAPRQLTSLVKSALDRSTFEVKTASHRAVEVTMDGTDAKLITTDKNAEKFDNELVKMLAAKYSIYKLAAAYAMQTLSGELDERELALIAAQNVIGKQ